MEQGDEGRRGIARCVVSPLLRCCASPV